MYIDDDDEDIPNHHENAAHCDVRTLIKILSRSKVSNAIVSFEGGNDARVFLDLDFCVRITDCKKSSDPLVRNVGMITILKGEMYTLPRPLENMFLEVLLHKPYYKLDVGLLHLKSNQIVLSRSVKPKYPETSVSVKPKVSLNYLGEHELIIGACCPFDLYPELLPYPIQATDTDGSDVAEASPTAVTDNPGASNQVTHLPAHPNLFHNHRHMNYCDIRARHETFRNWPHPSTQDPVCLVEYGFFYTGKGDLVRCYSCGIGLKDWGEGDDPLLEHIKHSEHCKHIEFHLDLTLVEQYKSRLRGSSSGNQNVHRHPEYQHVDTRLSSFARWPRSLRPSHEVAAAGFFYTGFQDLVRCFHCDGGLRSWDPNDDPWVEHARWFPDCEFVIQTKGEQFVQNVQAAVQGSDPEEEEISNQMGGMRLYGPIDPTQLKRESDHPIYTPAAQDVINTYGYSRAAVRMVIDECIAEKKQWNTEVLVNMLADKQERGIPLPEDIQRPKSPLQSSSFEDSSEENVFDTYMTMRSNIKCLQCEEADADVIFLPCGHHRMCTGCSFGVILCPMCGETVKEQIKTYRA